MTPLVPPPPDQHAGDASRRAVAFLGGFFAALLLVGALSVVFVTRASREAREGWQLRAVVVSAVDVTAGTPITLELISQRSIPEQFLVGDEILPENAPSIIGKKLGLELQQGDPLRRGDFTVARIDACQESVRGIADQLGTTGQPGVTALLDALARTGPGAKEEN